MSSKIDVLRELGYVFELADMYDAASAVLGRANELTTAEIGWCHDEVGGRPHCWHLAGDPSLLVNWSHRTYMCCWCGETRSVRTDAESGEHGEYKP